MLGFVEIVGNSAARLKRISARAWRKRASAIFNSWFPSMACCSSAVSCGSPNVSHHFAGSDGAPGCANFQSLVSLKLSGGASLNAAVMGVSGFTYFGPTMHPASINAKMSASVRRVFIAPTLPRTRTGAPLSSESDGSRMIESEGRRPDTISTLAP